MELFKVFTYKEISYSKTNNNENQNIGSLGIKAICKERLKNTPTYGMSFSLVNVEFEADEDEDELAALK